ncbi:MAG: aminoacyl-tRNA hydrolase [Phycisphaerales bacterium]|jgi:peptidyl-tRNA hydrolase, PTH1 family|nr:aminoacyl-tRNA hydrolase [Phycisphaerales bacterium]MBT7170786.1 aminoacyl-tRNA hydrolase [Phycisphaerales bacterium]
MADHDEPRRKFVVGLGNPGRRYQGTRHNVGFDVLDTLQRRWMLGEPKTAFGGLTWDARYTRFDEEPVRVALLAPQTFMNCSGQPTAQLLSFYKGQPSDVLVVVDDYAIDLGRLRLRPGGSAGGHNGLKDMARHLGTEDYARLRVGVGPCPGVMDSADFVLGKFAKKEIEEIGVSIERAADAVEAWLTQEVHAVMERYNQAP